MEEKYNFCWIWNANPVNDNGSVQNLDKFDPVRTLSFWFNKFYGAYAKCAAAGSEIAGLVLQWWICVTMPTRYLHYFNMLRKCQWPHVMRFVAVSASADKIDFYMRTYLHARVCRCTLLRVCTSPTQPVWNDRRSQCVAPDLIAWSFT